MPSFQQWRTMAVAILLSGAMTFLSAGINHVWILAWLAPIPVLVVVVELGVLRAAVTAFLAAALGALSFVLAYPKFPPLMLASLAPLMAVPSTLVVLAWRAMFRRVGPVGAVVAYPALVSTTEYAMSLVSPNGTFGSLAYSQGDLPVVLQIASVTGLWGVTFLLALVAAALAVAWLRRRERRIAASTLTLAATPLAMALLFGAVRLAGSEPSHQVRVGLAASDVGASWHFAARDPGEALPVVQAYADRAVALANEGVQVVVLPEKFVGITPTYYDEARALLAKAAHDHHVTIVAGLNLLSEPQRRNVAIVLGTDGGTALQYDKQHLVPGFEAGYRPGNGIGVIAGTDPTTGVAICKDLDFVSLGRAYARARVGLLLVPAWDFVNDGWLHSRMAVLRGVEGGFAVARSAAAGRLTISDAHGRIVAERSSSEAADVRLAAGVPVGPGGTFYSRTGDWFAWMCGLMVVACIGASARPTVRSK